MIRLSKYAKIGFKHGYVVVSSYALVRSHEKHPIRTVLKPPWNEIQLALQIEPPLYGSSCAEFPRQIAAVDLKQILEPGPKQLKMLCW